MFGREEMDLSPCHPGVCRSWDSRFAPIPPTVLYYRAHTGEFDLVISPYHDQQLAPVKLIGHGESTNVTLGLPYVRTSPDHGTALAIAGKGIADPSGMISAMRCAVDLCDRRQLTA
jgi:4-hydroxythreonine-4-phosphate dehydrogenase